MKNLICLVFCLFIITSITAQKKPKIKGDKEVVMIDQMIVDEFDQLEVDGPFERYHYHQGAEWGVTSI
jgi:hypothetical protein